MDTKPNNRTEVGERIFKARRKLGITQTELAEKLGVSQQLVTFWEREAKAPTSEILPELSKILNVSIDELLGTSHPSLKRGPESDLEKQFQRVAKLPKRQQKKIFAVIDTLLDVK